MNIEEYRNYCLSLPETSEKMPFDENTLVFYVKNKMFALTNVDNFDYINLKCDPELAITLREEYGAVRPGFHMSKKHWNTVDMDGSIANSTLKEWIYNSYKLVIKGMPKKDQVGLLEE